MPKRGENIHKRADGRWEGRFIVCRDVDGKVHYKSVYGKKYTEVKNKLRTQTSIDEIMKDTVQKKSIEEICREWLNKVQIKLKQSSYARYYTIVYTHILPYFKSNDIQKLTGQTVEKFIEKKLYNGRLDGKGSLSSKTIRDIYAILIQIIKYAEKSQYIQNFNYDIALPRIETNDYSVLNAGEQKTLVKYIHNNIDNEKIGVLIALYTGIRIGELCALKWSDINLDIELVRVTKTIQRIKDVNGTGKAKTKIIIDRPKSQKSIRDIPLPDILITILKKFYSKHNPEAYILTGTGKYIEPRIYQDKFKKYLEEANIKQTNFHVLRHTFATRAVELNFDVKTLSEVLGHSTVKFTLDRYVHSSHALKKENMNKMSFSY